MMNDIAAPTFDGRRGATGGAVRRRGTRPLVFLVALLVGAFASAPTPSAAAGGDRFGRTETDSDERTDRHAARLDVASAPSAPAVLELERAGDGAAPLLIGLLGVGALLLVVRAITDGNRRSAPRRADPDQSPSWDGGAATVVGDADDRDVGMGGDGDGGGGGDGGGE